MSEDLKDEVEAINSIYGNGCLVQSKDETSVYILTPPGKSVSLRIQFSPEYPAEAPAVIGTNSTGEDGKRGDAARELFLFREAVRSVYQPGMVCLFDTIEEVMRRLEEQAGQDQASRAPAQTRDEGETRAVEAEPRSEDLPLAEPAWTISDPVLEMKSTFIARCAVVASTQEAAGFVQHLLASDKKVRTATHNMTAWRIKGRDKISFQDCDDDGETAAGSRLLRLMQLMDLWNIVVVVSRWYGGQKLGPRRFALINSVARDAFVKAGLVTTPSSAKTHEGRREG